MSKAYDDFIRLAGGLRSMIYDFNKRKNTGGYGPNTAGTVIKDDVDIDAANLTTSRTKNGSYDLNAGKFVHDDLHRVVLDLDMDAALIPSSTPGHHHLILDLDIPWNKYVRLLCALADAGVIERGYADAAVNNGFTAIRTPWTRKEQGEEAA